MSKGGAYGVFHRQFVKFVLSDDIAVDFIHWLNDTHAPEENVWSTLNTLDWAPGGYKIETRHSVYTVLSRAVIWQWDKVECRGKLVRSVCVLGSGDLPWLRSRPELIANKFDISFDPVAIDCLKEVYRNNTKHETTHLLNWYFYRNLPHVKIYSKLNQTDRSFERLSQQKTIWLNKQKLKQFNQLSVKQNKSKIKT